MKLIYATVFSLALFCQGYAQQVPLGQRITNYQTAMEMLSRFHKSMPQSHKATTKEWIRLNKDYKRVLDSLQDQLPTTAVFFEAQRLIDNVNYRITDEGLNKKLNALYNHFTQHQKELISNDESLKNIAQCIIGIRPGGLTNETEIIDYHGQLVQRFYDGLNTGKWSEEMDQRFFTFFASQYLNTGSVRKAEKFYRQFDTLLAVIPVKNNLEVFSLPDTLNYQNGALRYTPVHWQVLQTDKIVIQPSSQSLYDFVNLVSLLRIIHRHYVGKYEVIIARKRNQISNEYLSAIKRNLDFADYYIATINSNSEDAAANFPEVIIVDAENKISYKAGRVSALFQKLNGPIEEAKAKEEKQRLAKLAAKKAALKKRSLQMKDSVCYQYTHKQITFLLKGLWEAGLSSQLNELDFNEGASEITTPYLAQFEVKRPEYSTYQLLVWVTGEEQEITITAGYPYKQEVSYANKKNAAFHKAKETIDQSIVEVLSYTDVKNTYPFQNSSLIEYLSKTIKQTSNKEQQAIKKVKNKEARKILEQYKQEKHQRFGL